MIVYKVVEKGTRYGTNMCLFKGHVHRNHLNFYGNIKIKTIKIRLKQWFPRYSKGSIVKAAPGSIGIMCFETKVVAENFKNFYNTLNRNAKIIKVRGLKLNFAYSII